MAQFPKSCAQRPMGSCLVILLYNIIFILFFFYNYWCMLRIRVSTGDWEPQPNWNRIDGLLFNRIRYGTSLAIRLPFALLVAKSWPLRAAKRECRVPIGRSAASLEILFKEPAEATSSCSGHSIGDALGDPPGVDAIGLHWTSLDSIGCILLETSIGTYWNFKSIAFYRWESIRTGSTPMIQVCC